MTHAVSTFSPHRRYSQVLIKRCLNESRDTEIHAHFVAGFPNIAKEDDIDLMDKP
jgi:hypothetical protein